MLAALIFLLVLSVLVLIHELGHYVAARLCGVKAEEFGYGFPPRAIGFVRVDGKWKRVSAGDKATYKNTIWSLNWLPLGGFVRLKGEQGEDGNDPASFLSKGAPARAFILAAGVMMNWILAAVIFSAGFMIGVPTETTDLPASATIRDREIQITEVIKGSAADKSGIQAGDFITSIDGQPILLVKDAKSLLAAHASAGTPLTLGLIQNHQQKTITTTPEYLEALDRPGLGVALADTAIVSFPWYIAIGEGISITFSYTKLILLSFGGLVRDLFVQHRVTADVSGPVGIAVMTGRIAEQGWWSLIQFSALLSINLAIVNFLPIPALDGGRALFVLIETLRRKRNNPRFEAAIHQIGFVALLILVLLVTVHDLRQYGGVIVHGLKTIVGL